MRSYRLHHLAVEELSVAAMWYAEQSAIVADRFLIAIERGLSMIIENPRAWAVRRANARAYQLDGYPFAIVYRVPDDHDAPVLVIAVAHYARRSGYWSRRR